MGSPSHMTVRELRRRAVAQTLSPARTVSAAVRDLGFVQADPIQAPARAQDLILRQRVAGYRVGDLDRGYSRLALEEDVLYAYGYMPRSVWSLCAVRDRAGLTKLERRVLGVVEESGRVHPRDLDEEFGTARERNAWGGYSKTTKRTLERLHRRALVRIVRRERGVRIYGPAPHDPSGASATDRLRALVLVYARIFAPAPRKSLHAVLAPLRRRLRVSTAVPAIVDHLLAEGQLDSAMVDGVEYILTPDCATCDEPRTVRFLAPFDPVVFDRARFEHLWGWPYRFEAYTPPAKRARGYYALPLLWGTDVIGWVNATVANGALAVDDGYVRRRPASAAFRRAFDAEVTRLRAFLRAAPHS